MAVEWGVDAKEWKEMQKKLEKISQDSNNDSLPYFLRGFIAEMAERVIAKTKPRTPKDTGALRSAWQLGSITRKGQNFEIEILNPMEYASEVEFGHRIMGGEGHTKEKGWKDGRFMLTISITEIKKQMPLRFAQQWSQFCKKWGL